MKGDGLYSNEISRSLYNPLLKGEGGHAFVHVAGGAIDFPNLPNTVGSGIAWSPLALILNPH